MNWNYWLPWRDYPRDDTEDSSYEDEVIERCDHNDYEWTPTDRSRKVLATPDTDSPGISQYFCAVIDEGHAVFNVMREEEAYCVDCGKRVCAPTMRRVKKIALPINYEIDPGLSLSDGIAEPTEQPADFVVDEDGEAEKVENEEGAGRVIVNQSDDAAYGVTD
jgi:hypothetical protein